MKEETDEESICSSSQRSSVRAAVNREPVFQSHRTRQNTAKSLKMLLLLNPRTEGREKVCWRRTSWQPSESIVYNTAEAVFVTPWRSKGRFLRGR